MQDFRDELTQTKHYLCVPDPLLAYLCTLDLTVKQLVIFLLHWSAGHINGNWKSQLAVALVARKAACSEATVKRAYSKLAKLKLIRRLQGASKRSGERTITVTEVLVPEGATDFLASSQNRAPATKHFTAQAELREQSMVRGERCPSPSTNGLDGQGRDRRDDLRIAAKQHNSRIECTRIIPNRLAEALRSEVSKLMDTAEPAEVERTAREMLWSIAYGQLLQVENIHIAKNAALKMLREGRWSTPKGMPGSCDPLV